MAEIRPNVGGEGRSVGVGADRVERPAVLPPRVPNRDPSAILPLAFGKSMPYARTEIALVERRDFPVSHEDGRRHGSRNRGRQPSGALLLEGSDRGVALEGHADLVEALKQALADKRIDVERRLETATVVNRALFEVDC